MNDDHSLKQIKNQVFEKLGQITATLASPARLKLIQLLAQSPKTVDELSQASGESIANTSQHLQKLSKEGLVFSTRQAQRRIYQVKSPRIIALWENIQVLAHELAPELDAAENILTDDSLRSSLSLAEILQKVDSGRAMLVDVRNSKEASSSSVPGSVSIPLAAIEATMKELSKQKTYYIFCRGRYCRMATAAVRLLKENGFTAYRLRESSFAIIAQQATEEGEFL